LLAVAADLDRFGSQVDRDDLAAAEADLEPGPSEHRFDQRHHQSDEEAEDECARQTPDKIAESDISGEHVANGPDASAEQSADEAVGLLEVGDDEGQPAPGESA
jgi:hypothetical protein